MNNRRTAILMLKYIDACSREDVEHNIIAQFTDNPFEQRFIILASHWGNDMIDLCLEELGIVSPHLAYKWPESQDWAVWFEKTVGEMVVPND